MNNVIFIEFFNKSHFPAGVWCKEPDLCCWENKFVCLAIRDMGMGVWRGFVGVDGYHPFYGKSINQIIKLPEASDIFFAVYGGLSGAGKLPLRYKEYSQNLWWIGIETSHGGDLMPFLKLEGTPEEVSKMTSGQSYKDFHFIRKQTNKLADLLCKIQ